MHPLINFKIVCYRTGELSDKTGFLIKDYIENALIMFVVPSDGAISHYETGRVFCYINTTKVVKRLSHQRYFKSVDAIKKTIDKHGVDKIMKTFRSFESINSLQGMLS